MLFAPFLDPLVETSFQLHVFADESDHHYQFLYAMDKGKENFPFSSILFQFFPLFYQPSFPLPYVPEKKYLCHNKPFLI